MEKLQVLYQDNHLIAVNKPAGIPIQGDPSGDTSLLDMVKEYIRLTFNKPGEAFCGLIHRIDRPVSGLSIFAKTSKALERMNAMFKERHIQKTYWAVVGQNPPSHQATLQHWIRKNSENNTVKAYSKFVAGGKEAILDYRVISESGGFYLLEVNPLTGRPHQIRAQLSKIGCPIQGDIKYGFNQKNIDRSISLHARSLAFVHPTKNEKILIKAPLPKNEVWQRYWDFEKHNG
jgi:23S rRNA pseudouridine1911/1915/1917 synthase